MYKESFVMKVLEMRFCWKELEQTHLFTPPKYGMHSKQILQKLKQPSLFFRSAEINFWLLPGHNVYIITIRGYLKLKWFLPLKSVIFEHYFCSYKMFVWSLNSDKQTFTPLITLFATWHAFVWRWRKLFSEKSRQLLLWNLRNNNCIHREHATTSFLLHVSRSSITGA